MPLQSSGIIVVDKTSVLAASSTTPTITNNKSNLQQFYEYYDVNDGGGTTTVGSIISEPNNNNSTGNTNPVMRRHQRTISSSSSSSTHSPSSTTIQQHKHHQVVTTNLQTLAYNQQQQQHQQQQQQQQQINQQQHHQQSSHHVSASSSSSSGPQQLIVSEDYIEHTQSGGGTNSSSGGNGNVMISTANDVLNQQIIKIVTADGTTGNMIIDSMGNVTTTNGSGGAGNNGTSKVLFNNLTVLSKQSNAAGTGEVTTTSGQLTQQQHHQQTINFVNAKSLPYITTSSKGQTTTVQKMTAYKGNNVAIKQGNATQQHHVLTTSGGHTVIGQQQGQPQQQVVQKVTMPRNVQMVTRVQTLVAPQHSPQQQQHNSVQHTNSGQMVMQQKYVHNIVTSGVGGGKTNLIKKTTGQSMKLQQHKIISTQQPQGVKTFIQQQPSGTNGQQQNYQTINIHPSQHQTSVTVAPQTTLKHVKSQKIIKQYNNAITNSSGAVSVATLHQNHSSNASSVATSGTYTISNKINNVSGAGLHQQHHLSTKMSKHPKYVMQNHIVIPSSSNAPSQNQNHKVNNASGNTIMVNQQILNTINSCNNSSGTIKFVNAHGTVIQQQQQQQAPTIITTTTQKVRTNSGSNGGSGSHQYQQPQQVHITQQQFVTADGGKSDGNNIYHISSTPTGGYIQGGGPQHNARQSSPLHADDIMIVNGTQMTDELSARILQSMAQKSFNNQQRFHHHQPPTTKIIHQSSSMPPPTQLTVQQQQHHTSTSNLILSPKEYPIYGVQQQQQYQQQQQQRIVNSAPNSRSQSLERKYHDTTISTKKAASEYYKIKNDTIVNHQQQQSTAVAMASRIPVGTTLTQHHHHQQHQQQQQQIQQQQQHHQQQQLATQQSAAADDDELIGEEVRPTPVNTSDLRLQVLQAVLQDHTYVVAMPTRIPIELPTSSSAVLSNNAAQQPSQQLQQTQKTVATAIVSTTTPVIGQPKSTPDTKLVYSTSGPVTVVSGVSTATVPQLSIANVNAQNSQHSTPTTTSYTIYGQQITRPNQDDDANSAISNGSTRGAGESGDIDPGEETETAPEAEAEDDSITRCICDFAHDDGYMICCDKCSAWQHVDCMGIDRQNIPDEYLCDICQPREVDRARARTLQLQKRKEQTQMLLNAAQHNSVGTPVLIPNDTMNGGGTGTLQQQQLSVVPVANSTAPQLNKKGKIIKRKELVKKTKKEKTTGVGATAKRRENKKTTKRKSKSSGGDPVDRYAANLRQWIENYELAVTNHYSPELRARLHAISKQPNLLQIITATENKTLKYCGSLESKATTVPHAGGKILISNFDIAPNSPIFELRGKYMLTTQYKTQNSSINMNSPPPSNYLQTLKSHKIPGAFIFFYQLPGDGGQIGPEICVDTRTYGNEARFVRRSCRPNAVIQHLFEKGTIHLYIVSLTNIMASTEITIKHEPHDLLALESKKQYSFAIQPTSTSCACGLTKDCLFGALPPMPPAVVSTKPVRSNSKVVLNGCVEKSANAPSKKKAQNMNRGRSTSSSGDSNAGLLSPNNNNHSFAPNHLYNSTTSIASLMHDSGVYTSSSSPSVSIPSPPTTQISSPPAQQIQMQMPIQQPVQQQPPQQQLVPQTIQHVTHMKLTPPSPQPQINSLPVPLPPPQLPLPPQTPQQVIEPIAEPIIVQAVPEVSPIEELPAEAPVIVASPIKIAPQEIKLEVEPPQAVIQSNADEETEVYLPTVAPQSQPLPQPQPMPQVVVTEEAEIVPITVPLPEPEMIPRCSTQQIQHVPYLPLPQEQQPHDAIAPENPVPDSPSSAGGSPVKSPLKPSCGRKTPAKLPRTSISEDSSNSAQQQPPTATTPTPPKQEEKRESRKLTREERKMEAILRAFEKMEKNQQRKQELKQAKTEISKRRNSNSPSPKRSNSTDSTAPVNTSFQSAKKNATSMRKKKRKSYKSYNVNSSSQRKRRKSRMNSNDSDGAATSEESTSMLSPPIQSLENCIPPGGIPTPEAVASRQSQFISQLEGGDQEQLSQQQVLDEPEQLPINPPAAANVDTAAGLLLAFANPDKDPNTSQDSESMSDSMKSPERQDISGDSQAISPPPTPTIVSSTCLLIEAAVGPLENLPESAGSSGEFKYPAKTKTKKVLMSNWLNQSCDFQPSPEALIEHHDEVHADVIMQQYQPQPQPSTSIISAPSPSVGLESVVQAAVGDYELPVVASPSFLSHVPSPMVRDEPHNLSMVAKKVEEFIHQSEGNPVPTAIVPPPPTVSQRSALTLPLQVSTCSNNSSVKKRWLRQAISEETDESSMTTPLSAASPQLANGFTTPLKKRRLVINSDDPNAITSGTLDDCTPEDLSHFQRIDSEGEAIKQEEQTEIKEELKQEMTDFDDDVDILRSPSPGQKMVAEDNMVKIEPEDVTGGDDVKIDVEREESREGGGERFVYKEELKEDQEQAHQQSPKVEAVKIEEDSKVEGAVKEENETQEHENEHVDVIDVVKSEDEFIAVVDDPVTVISNTLPIISHKQGEIKVKVEEMQVQHPPSPLQEVKSDDAKPTKVIKIDESGRKKPKIEEKCTAKQRRTSLSSTPPIVAPKLESSTENENIPDELADIQERLHSFHKENIMILQSRNKKSKSPKHSSSTSSSKLTSHSSASTDVPKKKASKKPKKDRKSTKGEEAVSTSTKSKSGKKSSLSSTSKMEKDKNRHRTSSTSSLSSSKKRQLNFEHIDRGAAYHKRSNSTSSSKEECSSAKKRRESSRSEDSHKSTSSSGKSHKLTTSLALLPFQEQSHMFVPQTPLPPPQPPPPASVAGALPSVVSSILPTITKEAIHHAAMTIPCFNHTVVNAMPIAGYVLANSAVPLPPATQGYDMQTLMKVPPAGVQTSTATTFGVHHLPYYNTIYGKLLDTPTTPPESIPTTTTTLTTPTTPTTPTPPNIILSDYLDTKTKSFSSLGGFGSHSTLFCSLNAVKSITASVVSNESPIATTAAVQSDASSPVSEGSLRLATTPLKMLTKTASHDPRLNPNLTAPEPPPAPKRKLSINEYRKRKQQSTDSNIGSPEGDSAFSTPTTSSIKSGSTNENAFDKAFDDCEHRNGSSLVNKIDDTPRVQFSPAPTLLEKQQESISERLKTLKSKQVASAMGISSLLDTSSNHLSLHKNEFISLTLNRTNSDLDNCLESISSSSTSLASSRESTPEPRDHTSHVSYNCSTNKSHLSSPSSSLSSLSPNQVTTSTTTTTKATTTTLSSEICLSYSPILDTSADNFDSPIAESIEQQKTAAATSILSLSPDKVETPAHGKRD